MSLPTPIGKQREVLCLPEEGHYVVLGTAGSGKTTLAIHRAAYLSHRIKSDERVLLVTFNKSLRTYLNSLINDDGYLEKVDVRNYHAFARGYLSSRGMLRSNEIVPSSKLKLRYIEMAIENVKMEHGNHQTLHRNAEVFYEEISWIQKMGIFSIEEYEDAERIGRSGTRITRDKRYLFFLVYESYLKIRAEDNYKYDWDDIANTVVNELENDSSEKMYQHIIIDEGQDLSPAMLKSLSLAVADNGSLTFFGDVAQQIYGGRISWRNAGLNVMNDSIWKFDQNYRNSKEIANLALKISNQPFFKKHVDLVIPKNPIASGPLPVLLMFRRELEELQWAAETASQLCRTQTVAILFRTREQLSKLRGYLKEKGIIPQELSGYLRDWDNNPGVSIGTFHSAKGLEFDAVIIPHCSTDRLPNIEKVDSLGDRDEALGEEAKLIYVAVTRAKRILVISYTGELTEIIPNDDSLFQKTR
ncbi:ATP-dependent helicase [Exiguobacterium sp. SH5S13]|uniref:3'-5' exonuclease n=1 Tax=Exiguobacterium sp. SH5S13 TaxID=2510959 RepID=UPI0010395DEA|nr:ATP-dependent helicase [Exiguobacterium sp. SH5S13]TCI49567.1 ATP-dependent helicase [Exiguobacterium sp. SH5S13]